MASDDRDPRAFEEGGGSYRSFFWPVLLIGVGILLLLGQLGIIAPINWGALLRFWPVLLILAGIDMLFGRRWPVVSSLLGLLVVGCVVGGIIAAPPAAEPLDLPARLSRIELPTEVRHASYREPLGQAEAANIVLSLSSFPTTVQALTEGDALIEAEVDYIGQMRFDVTGARTRYVVLDEERSGWSMSLGTQRSAHRWEIGLSPDLPIDLTIDAGSGSSQLELGQLNLRSLLVDGGSGSVHLSLPHQELPVRVDSGSGSCHIELPEGARTDLRLNTGSGSVEVRLGEAADVRITAQDVGSGSLTFRLPADSAVQLTVDDEGSGSIRTPRGLDRVKGRSGEDVGVWESKDYGRAERQVTIRVDDMGSGSVSLEWDR